MKTAIYNVFGKDVANELIEVNYTIHNLNISGVIGTPKVSRSTRGHEFTYINNRFVKDKTMMSALEKAFDQNLNIGKFPFAVLNLSISPNEVDVNVHPAKLEVKFENESKVFEVIYHGVTNALLNYHKATSPFAVIENKTDKIDITQEQKNSYINTEKERDTIVNATNIVEKVEKDVILEQKSELVKNVQNPIV